MCTNGFQREGLRNRSSSKVMFFLRDVSSEERFPRRFQAYLLVARAGAAYNSPTRLPPALRRVVLSVYLLDFSSRGHLNSIKKSTDDAHPRGRPPGLASHDGRACQGLARETGRTATERPGMTLISRRLCLGSSAPAADKSTVTFSTSCASPVVASQHNAGHGTPTQTRLHRFVSWRAPCGQQLARGMQLCRPFATCTMQCSHCQPPRDLCARRAAHTRHRPPAPSTGPGRLCAWQDSPWLVAMTAKVPSSASQVSASTTGVML